MFCLLLSQSQCAKAAQLVKLSSAKFCNTLLRLFNLGLTRCKCARTAKFGVIAADGSCYLTLVRCFSSARQNNIHMRVYCTSLFCHCCIVCTDSFTAVIFIRIYTDQLLGLLASKSRFSVHGAALLPRSHLTSIEFRRCTNFQGYFSRCQPSIIY